MDIKEMFVSQYAAGLEMLKKAVTLCNYDLWLDKNNGNPFWQNAFHALFYTDFYLSESEESFVEWEKYRKNYESYQEIAEQPHEPFTKDEILEYHDKILFSLRDRLEKIDLESPSGFYWLEFNKLELQTYNIRHLQHHVGQLIYLLRVKQNVGVKWVRNVKL